MPFHISLLSQSLSYLCFWCQALAEMSASDVRHWLTSKKKKNPKKTHTLFEFCQKSEHTWLTVCFSRLHYFPSLSAHTGWGRPFTSSQCLVSASLMSHPSSLEQQVVPPYRLILEGALLADPPSQNCLQGATGESRAWGFLEENVLTNIPQMYPCIHSFNHQDTLALTHGRHWADIWDTHRTKTLCAHNELHSLAEINYRPAIFITKISADWLKMLLSTPKGPALRHRYLVMLSGTVLL
jgi:hypothetical protein